VVDGPKDGTLRIKRLLAAGLFWAAAACGSGETSDRPVTPVEPGPGGGGNSANVTAPTVDSPTDDAQTGTLRPTLVVNNATSTGSGSRSYEFQIADNSSFATAPGALTSVVAVSQSGITEGPGKTSFTPASDLLPSTRYYWRARASQGGSTGPWSSASRVRTQEGSFKSGNQAFDLLTNGQSVSDQRRNISFVPAGDANPGCKLEGADSFIRYQISTLSEGEVSFILRRVKPFDSTFDGQIKLFTMQDGTGDFNSNPFRVAVEKRPASEGQRLLVMWTAGGTSATAATGGLDWADHRPYYFKIEWRAGTGRVRVFLGETESAPTFADVSVGYPGAYSPSAHNIIVGSLMNDSYRDIRASRLYIGPGPRPVQ
jgi:hypothetical protein